MSAPFSSWSLFFLDCDRDVEALGTGTVTLSSAALSRLAIGQYIKQRYKGTKYGEVLQDVLEFLESNTF